MPRPRAARRNGSRGKDWGGALVEGGMGGCVSMTDVETSPDDNMSIGSPGFINNYQLRRFILAMGTWDVERGSALWDNPKL